MARIVLCLTVVGSLLILPQLARAQSPEMPEPLLVLLDVDGKPMVQVVDISGASVVVLFDFDGVPARFNIVPDGHFMSGSGVYFSEPNCGGEMYLSSPQASAVWEWLTLAYFAIHGPNSDDGTYRVFRSTSLDPVALTPGSGLSLAGECVPAGGLFSALVPAEEILPNPLAGFHGPTVADPEPRMAVKGGTRLP